jgi:hypothetical protein
VGAFVSFKTYQPSLGVEAMVLMDAGVNVMESDDDVQWRLVLMIQAKVQVVVATQLTVETACLVPTFNSCLYHLVYIQVYILTINLLYSTASLPYHTPTPTSLNKQSYQNEELP